MADGGRDTDWTKFKQVFGFTPCARKSALTSKVERQIVRSRLDIMRAALEGLQAELIMTSRKDLRDGCDLLALRDELEKLETEEGKLIETLEEAEKLAKHAGFTL